MGALASLSPDALRQVLSQLPQADRATCLLVSKYLNTSVTDPSLWTSMRVAEPDATAVRFFKKTRPVSLCVDSASPDDTIWFLERLVDEACHTTLRTLIINFDVVTRIPEALLFIVTRFMELETLSITVEECEEECLLRLPSWFTGLRRLTALSIREGSGDPGDPWLCERHLAVRFGAARALLPALESLTLMVRKSDLLTGTTGLAAMPSLRRLVHVTDVETFDNFTVGPGQTLDYLEVSFGEESVPDAFGEGMQRFGSVDKLVIHARSELYLGTPVPAKEVSIVMESEAFSDTSEAQVCLDYPFFSSEALGRLSIDQTESSQPGWSVRIINAPSAMQCLDVLAKLKFNLASPGQLHITPYDF
jgi:hypothetical protein